MVLPADTFTRSYTGPSVSFAGPGASYDEIVRRSVVTRFDKSQEVSATLSVVVVIRPAPGKRLTPGLILGVTNHRVRDRTVYTPVAIPKGIDPRHPSVVGSTETHSRNIGGPTFGANLAIALTRQLSIVPDVRYDYGSIGDGSTTRSARQCGCSGGFRLRGEGEKTELTVSPRSNGANGDARRLSRSGRPETGRVAGRNGRRGASGKWRNSKDPVFQKCLEFRRSPDAARAFARRGRSSVVSRGIQLRFSAVKPVDSVISQAVTFSTVVPPMPSAARPVVCLWARAICDL